jgi:hypothetical protein
MTPDEIFDSAVDEFRIAGRRSAPGLLVALVDFFQFLGTPGLGFTNFHEFLKQFPKVDTRNGRLLRVLAVSYPGGEVSVRRFYDVVEDLIRNKNHRSDYPSMPGHATSRWDDYITWLDSLVTYSAADLANLRVRVVDFLLATLPSHAFDPSSAPPTAVPFFHHFLSEFDFTHHRGEPTGAPFQGVVFAYLRADNPHLQVEVRKVRTGSRRQSGVGDVDGWDGNTLITSAEVKQFKFHENDVSALTPFGHETVRRGTHGLIVALDYDSEDTLKLIRDKGLTPLSLDDLLYLVSLWDPLKQRVAINALRYYIDHVEQNTNLMNRALPYYAPSELSAVEPKL